MLKLRVLVLQLAALLDHLLALICPAVCLLPVPGI